MKVGSANIRFPSRCELDSRGMRPVCLRCAGSSCGYVAVDAVVSLKVIVKLSGDLLEISLNRLLSIGGGYAGERLPGHEPASARKGYEEALVLRN